MERTSELSFDKEEMQSFAEGLISLHKDFIRDSEEGTQRYRNCRSNYTRIKGELEQERARYIMERERAQQRIRAAQETLRAATNSDDENSRNKKDAENAKRELEQAKAELAAAERKISIVGKKTARLNEVWQNYSVLADSALSKITESFSSFRSFSGSCAQDLGKIIGYMDIVKNTLQGSSAAASGSSGSTGSSGTLQSTLGSSSGRMNSSGNSAGAHIGSSSMTPGSASGALSASDNNGFLSGWCPKHHIENVCLDDNGNKMFRMNIGDSSMNFPCTLSGAAKAYRAAVKSGDSDLIARTSAIYEVEVFRSELDLGSGAADYPQLGGYHGDVSRQDPPGFESHHIPSRSIQDVNPNWLPAISISREDHEMTSSYSGKQKKVYKPLFSSGEGKKYIEDTSALLAKGSCGYIQLMKNEILDLVRDTGHRYDGGISAYFDAVIDMIARRGIPDAK